MSLTKKQVKFDNSVQYETESLSSQVTPAYDTTHPHFDMGATIPSGLNRLQMKQPKFQNRSSPPFRPGGRGAKQLSKALEQSTEAEEDSQSQYVMCYGKESPCYAKVMSCTSDKQTLITPMKASPYDNSLLVPMTGKLWLVKSSYLHPVEVRTRALLSLRLITTFHIK